MKTSAPFPEILLCLVENGLHLVVEKAAVGTLRLLHLSPETFDPQVIPKDEAARQRFTMVEVQRTGEDQDDHCGGKHTASNPGGPVGAPVYVTHHDTRNAHGRCLEFVQTAGELRVTSVLQFFDGLPVVRTETVLENAGNVPIPIEYVSSFALTGLGGNADGVWREHNRLHLPFNSWTTELQWRVFTLTELGLSRMRSRGFTMTRIAPSNTGSFGAKEMLPMGCLENVATGLFTAWQIETHGSWHWELAEIADRLYLQLSGPTEQENQWHKDLQPGERFVSIPAAIAMADSFDGVFQTLNQYRRSIRRPNADNRNLPVIFNDYMNCLEADPTTEKILPLVDRAAALGAEYYVIDAGWYADGPWWDSVGEWLESSARFPGGFQLVIDYIRKKGLQPGLWLELERMGKNCPLATQWPDECFFCRHGRRVVAHQSLQLDFRHPLVRRHANAVVDRLVGEWGIRFIKMDYNFEIGSGTEIAADSFGDGLLQHQRTYLAWLDAVLARYPDLVIENCSSGGLRNTYSMLSRLSICSTTDNTDYLANAKISINSAAAYCMEQAGVWSYPLATASDEEVIMNMVSCLSWRPYLSGQLWALRGAKLELMREGIRLYKNYLRSLIPAAQPVWPLGMVKSGDAWGAFGLRVQDKIILSVWHFEDGSDEMEIPLIDNGFKHIRCIYPTSLSCRFAIRPDSLQLACPPKTAWMFELSL